MKQQNVDNIARYNTMDSFVHKIFTWSVPYYNYEELASIENDIVRDAKRNNKIDLERYFDEIVSNTDPFLSSELDFPFAQTLYYPML